MQFKENVQSYNAYLYTFSYILVQDQKVAEQIVRDVVQKYYAKQFQQLPDSFNKSLLTEKVVQACRSYFASWDYRKNQLSQWRKREKSTTGGAGAATEIISSLPLAIRSVAALRYYGQFQTIEIANMLNLPVATVNKQIEKAQSALRTHFSESEIDKLPQIIHSEIQLGSDILDELSSIVSNVKRSDSRNNKLLNWKTGMAVSLTIAILLVGFILFKPKTEEVSTPILIEQPAPTLASEELRVPSELTFSIAFYENYYLDSNFYSEQTAKLIGEIDVLDRFSYLYYLDQHNIVVNEERRDYYESRAKAQLARKKDDPFFKMYFTKLQQQLQITEDDYIEHYLILDVEYRDLMDRFYQDIKNDDVYEQLVEEYYALAGFQKNQLTENLSTLRSESYHEGVEQHQDDLPFELPSAQVVKNEQGELLISNPQYFYLGDSKYEKLSLKLSGFDYTLDFNRVILEYFLTTLNMYRTEDVEEAQLAKELYELLLVLERSIEK